MKYLILILLISCNQEKTKKSEKVETPFETEYTKYLKYLPTGDRAFMLSCMDGLTSASFPHCYKSLASVSNGCPSDKSSESTGSTILKTATGTALGYGAAKLILGK